MKAGRKQVHLIEKYFMPVTAGIEVNMIETYSRLATKNWDITVHTSRDTLTETMVLPETDIIRGINIIRYQFKLFGFFPRIPWAEADYVCLHNFNVFPHLQIMLYTLFLKVLGQKNYTLFLTPHGGFNPEWSVFPLRTRLVKKLYHYTIGALLVNITVDGVRAVSNWEKNEMIAHNLNPGKIVVIDNGVEDEAYQDLEQFASQKIKDIVNENGRYIVQIGRVYPIKNYETVIKALVNTPQDIKYLIVGPVELNSYPEYKQELDDLIIKLGLTDRVKFLGVIKGVDKYFLIKHAQMMVHMAIWESFCNVVHEGLSQGLVCIVANNTALPLLVKDGINGYCIETFDSNAVSKKINYVLENKGSSVIGEMEKRNREYGLKNSWKDVSERVYKFYNLVGEGRLPAYVE